MEEIDRGAEGAPERWAARPLLLAGLGLATGIVVHLILGKSQIYENSLGTVQAALVLGVTLGAALIGFTIERRLWWAALLFGGVMGLFGYLIMLGNGAPGGWGAGEEWRLLSLVLALAIAAPLFQAARDEDTLRPSYRGVHDHVWANIVLWFASWLFVAIVWVMAVLLSELFHLIRIDFVRELLGKDWFGRAMTGLAFGSALGLLREHDVVVRTLQRVVAIVLAVLAPVLAVGLALFLIALPFTGVQALWDATSATTPLLLACAAGALILTNVVIGREDADERRNPALRYAAMVLAAVILPLAVLAAVATGLRIGQYGYTPERLWGVVFVGIALCWGAAYFVTLVLRRRGWARQVRPANLVLACLVCLLGFVLATPLISFNAISTRDQVGRLESGKIAPDKFDWPALAFDFGKPGRDALTRLRGSSNAAVRAEAVKAASAKTRWDLARSDARPDPADAVARNARMLPAGAVFPQGLIDVLSTSYLCHAESPCTVLMLSANEAVVFGRHCFAENNADAKPNTYPCLGGDRYVLSEGSWAEAQDTGVLTPAERAAAAAAYKEGKIEVRTVPRRQVFLGGMPVGAPFE
ncbi:DUF4153 domain-containing protein [Sphingomonas sp. HITSZ_GF]|uniref:DUF4153 domain-containing protein n=1 Tax=Sphingomonas sp. HITSZ_GF TaxID=3037247 RepID=UPI00240D54EF|nr:DUF4153 domain-containing protein [Sphingomonas sp. HITSZ_GF]MDG2532274.1 DUF4153 domain-containing protein [Sphingomonas sp. HITSZ_GF]